MNFNIWVKSYVFTHSKYAVLLHRKSPKSGRITISAVGRFSVLFDMLTHLLSHTHVNAYIINHKGNETENTKTRFDASCRAPFIGDGR